MSFSAALFPRACSCWRFTHPMTVTGLQKAQAREPSNPYRRSVLYNTPLSQYQVLSRSIFSRLVYHHMPYACGICVRSTGGLDRFCWGLGPWADPTESKADPAPDLVLESGKFTQGRAVSENGFGNNDRLLQLEIYFRKTSASGSRFFAKPHPQCHIPHANVVA